MRNAFSKAFFEEAKKDSRLMMVVADLSPAGAMEEFRKAFPDRFINVGVAEQAMIGVCAGLAMRGLRPFAYTIATFALYRPFEFIRNDLCYQNLPVTVVGMGSGLSYPTLGATHHAMEDVSVAGSIPGLTVVAPCDPHETELMTEWCSKSDGPKYLRLGKSGEGSITQYADKFIPGEVRYLQRGDKRCVMGYGPILSQYPAFGGSVVSVHTLKPLDVLGIQEVLYSHDEVLVVEEATPYLGPKVKEIAYDSGIECNVKTVSLKEKFAHYYGADLLSRMLCGNS
jgi:transketolase